MPKEPLFDIERDTGVVRAIRALQEIEPLGRGCGCGCVLGMTVSPLSAATLSAPAAFHTPDSYRFDSSFEAGPVVGAAQTQNELAMAMAHVA
jgi:hypothetical protein